VFLQIKITCAMLFMILITSLQNVYATQKYRLSRSLLHLLRLLTSNKKF